MKIAYLANGARGYACLQKLFDTDFDISVVVVQKTENNDGTANPICVLAENNNVPILCPPKINDEEALARIKAFNCDLMVMVGYNQILKKDALTLLPMGCINTHGGRLPDYRGGSPINWQIINGERDGECVIHYVNEGIDTGDILARKSYPIGPDDTAGDVIARTLEIFPDLLLQTLNDLQSGRAKPEPQDPMAGTYYCKRYPDDGHILWHEKTAIEVYNLVRSLDGPGLPGAFSYINGEKIIISRTKLMESEIKGLPGRAPFRRDGGVVVLARDKGLLVEEIRDANDMSRVLDLAKLTRAGRLE